jgi:hypothetical protein
MKKQHTHTTTAKNNTYFLMASRPLAPRVLETAQQTSGTRGDIHATVSEGFAPNSTRSNILLNYSLSQKISIVRTRCDKGVAMQGGNTFAKLLLVRKARADQDRVQKKVLNLQIANGSETSVFKNLTDMYS